MWLKLSNRIRDRLPECAVFAAGALLRLTMYRRDHVEWSGDGPAHWAYILSIVDGRLPPMDQNYVAYHPPLYHAVAAGLVSLGAARPGVTLLSVACGVAKFGLLWLGFERYLADRRARLAALALAAVLPSSILLDGTTSNEAMSCMLAAAAMLLWPQVAGETGRRTWLFAGLLGVVFGLGMLSKTSTLVLLAAFGAAVALNLLLPAKPVDWRARTRTLAPAVLAVVICAALCGWFYWRNVARYGAPFVTSYETKPGMVPSPPPPFLERRSLGFVFGWSGAIYAMPYYPVGLTPTAHFFPVAIAQTFADYYNVGLSDRRSDQSINGRPATKIGIWLARGANLGGTIIALAALLALAVCLRKTFERRDWGAFSLLITPLLAILLALSFAVRYPYNHHGVVKGTYALFGSAPLFAMFGLTVAWGLSRRRRLLAAGTLLLGLGAVAAFAAYCRAGFLL